MKEVTCPFDRGDPRPVSHVAGSSHNAGRTVTWFVICDACAFAWNEDTVWVAPVFRLGERVQ